MDLENWLSKQFVLMVSSVEKNVMNKLKSEFSNLFAEWFSMLVSETFNVRLDDDFTPVIEQQDYELPPAFRQLDVLSSVRDMLMKHHLFSWDL